jgi:hypothetical protein
MRWLLIMLLWLVPLLALAQSPQGTASTQTVKGDVLYWEGEELVVKEISGREVRLRVTAETKIEGVAGKLKTGDKIEASVTPEHQALRIALQLPGAGSTAPMP